MSITLKKQSISVILVFLLCMNSFITTVMSESRMSPFMDIENSYAYEAILTLAHDGIVVGYEDSMFRPYQAITRAELAAMTARAMSLASQNKHIHISQVPEWAEPSIRTVISSGIAVGKRNTDWSEGLTREELVVWFMRTLDMHHHVSKLDRASSFVHDQDIFEAARTSVWAAQQLGLIEGDEKGRFQPQQPADRQAAALITFRIYWNLSTIKGAAKSLFEKPIPIPSGNEDPANSTKPDNPVSENPAQPDDPESDPPSQPHVPDPEVPPLPPIPDPGTPPLPPIPDPETPTLPDHPGGPGYSVVESVYIRTKTIAAADSPHPEGWKLSYVLQDVYGDEIPLTQLPLDVVVSFEDDHHVFAADGSFAHFYNIPSPGSIISGNVHIRSATAQLSFSSPFQVVVEPWLNRKQYFAVSLLLEGSGAEATTIAEMETMRNMLTTIHPNAKVTWAMDNRFVFDEANRPQLAKVMEYVDLYGDEAGIASGYPNNTYTLADWAVEMDSWLYMYRYNALNYLHVGGTSGDPSVLASIPDKYKPKSLSTNAINPVQAAWLKEHVQIDAFMGWAAGHYNVGQLSAEGSPLMPYWAHSSNPMIPSQNPANHSGTVFFNAITIDPIGSHYVSGSSRWTIHPADPYVSEYNALPQRHVASQYMMNPFQNGNTMNYLSLVISMNWTLRTPNLIATWQDFIASFPQDADVSIVGIHKLAEQFKSKAGNTNDNTQFTLMFRGSGYTAQPGGETSDADLRYLWTETATERIILSKRDHEPSWNIIDFTDYSKTPVTPLPFTTGGAAEDISYITGRNYRLAPHAPLTQDELERVKSRLNGIRFNDAVIYH